MYSHFLCVLIRTCSSEENLGANGRASLRNAVSTMPLMAQSTTLCVKTWTALAEWKNAAEVFNSECKEDLERP